MRLTDKESVTEVLTGKEGVDLLLPLMFLPLLLWIGVTRIGIVEVNSIRVSIVLAFSIVWAIFLALSDVYLYSGEQCD